MDHFALHHKSSRYTGYLWPLCLLVTTLLAQSCQKPPGLSRLNVAHYYDPAPPLTLEAYAYNSAEGIQVILDLGYDQNEFPGGSPEKRFDLQWRLYPSMQKRQMEGSDTLKALEGWKSTKTNHWQRTIKLPEVSSGQSGWVWLKLSHAEENLAYVRITKIQNQSPAFRQGAQWWPRPFLYKGNSYTYQSTDSIAHYSLDYQLPNAPNRANPNEDYKHLRRLLTYRADSGKTLKNTGSKLLRYGDQNSFLLQEKPFPLPSKSEEMIEAMQYFLLKQDYKKIKNTQDPKNALQDAWLEIGGEETYTKLLMKTYYSRMETANRTLSGLKPGWMTEAGLILIIIGPPTEVFQNPRGETWYYPKAGNLPEAEFSFEYELSIFGSKELKLKRDQDYDALWYEAIELWRKGVVPR